MDNLRLNKFTSQCFQVTKSSNKFEFENPFNEDPEVFVVANKIIIQYGKDGSLQKPNVIAKANKEFVVFEMDESIQSDSMPICMLVINKSK